MSNSETMRVESAGEPVVPAQRWAKPPLGPHTILILFVLANLILCDLPLVPQLFGHGKGKDYPLWYQVGRLVLTGGDLYPKTGQMFGFLYPPVAAVLLAPFSLFGRAVSILCIDLVNVASWAIAAKLSGDLADVSGRKAWWVIALPSVISLPFIWDMYDRAAEPDAAGDHAGGPAAAAAAARLVGRRDVRGRRGAESVPDRNLPLPDLARPLAGGDQHGRDDGGLAAAVSRPVRGLERNFAEVETWAGGMIFSASEEGFGQRPEQNWGWKNNSIIAVVHRYVRPINAEAENPKAAPLYVNFLDLSYDQANFVLAVVAGLVGLGFVVALPPQKRRTPTPDAAEYALLIALMTITSPLARAYYFVWLLFPFTLLVYRAALDPEPRVRQWTTRLLLASLAVFTVGVSIASPHILPALGNMFWATAILIGALVWLMRRSMATCFPLTGHRSSKSSLTDSPS